MKRAMMPNSSTAESDANVLDGESTVEALLRVASIARTFRSPDGRFHARVLVGDRHEIYGLRSTAFRDWLIDSYQTERDELPPVRAVARVLAALEARARFDGAMPAVYVRVGCDRDGGGADCYLDLGDPTGRAVKIQRAPLVGGRSTSCPLSTP